MTLGSITLTWNAVSGDVDAYRIYRNTENTLSGSTTLFSASASPFIDTEVYYGRLYYYWVSAQNSTEGIEGPLSASDMGYSKLPPPQNITISSGGYHPSYAFSHVHISWDHMYGWYTYLLEDGFRVYRSSTSAGPWTDISGILDRYDYFTNAYNWNEWRLHYYDESSPPGVWYYYRVRTTTRTGNRLSDPTAAFQAYRPLPAPANMYATDNDPHRIVVTWDAVDRAARYRVARTRGSNMDYVVLGETTAQTYVDTTAEKGVSYRYQITPFQDLDPAHQGETGFSPFGMRP